MSSLSVGLLQIGILELNLHLGLRSCSWSKALVEQVGMLRMLCLRLEL